MGTLHCALENVSGFLYVNECQMIRHYSARSTGERRIRRKKNAKLLFLLRAVCT